MPLLLLPILICSCVHNKPDPIFVLSRVYILEKQGDNEYKIKNSSNSERTLEEEISFAPKNLIGLTQTKFVEVKNKIIELKAENEKLRNQQ